MSNTLCDVHPNLGGMKMDAKEYWQLFMETGAPEVYMLYTSALKMEGSHVSEHHSSGAESQRL